MNNDINTLSNQSLQNHVKDVVSGTLERIDLIEETINKYLKDDIVLEKTDKLLKIILFAAVFELMFKHNNPRNVMVRISALAASQK